MTNVTISISTSQIFRSWVAIFQLHPHMVSLFRSLYDMPGLAPRMDVLSWWRRDFQMGFSNRVTSRNAWDRHWGSFMVDMGILSNNMKFPSHKCWVTFWDLTIYNDNPLLIRLCTELDLLPNSEWFPWGFCDGCSIPTGDACSSGHLVPSLWDLHMFYLLRPVLFRTCRYLPDCALRVSVGAFSILLFHTFKINYLWTKFQNIKHLCFKVTIIWQVI